jgi:hypothetical protein
MVMKDFLARGQCQLTYGVFALIKTHRVEFRTVLKNTLPENLHPLAAEDDVSRRGNAAEVLRGCRRLIRGSGAHP